MSSRSKIRDSVVSTLKDLCNDLNLLSDKNGSPEDKPVIKDKVSLIQKKLDIISGLVSSGKVANRHLPELMELCEIFTINPDGTFEGCEADDVKDLLRQVSSKVAGAFEMVCFDDWNLLPECRASAAITPSPAPVPVNGCGQNTLQEVMEKLSVDEVESQNSSKPAALERESSISSEPTVSKAQNLVQIAQRTQPKKPVVLFNPMASKKAVAAKQDEVIPPSKSESLVGDHNSSASSSFSASVPHVLGANNNLFSPGLPPSSAGMEQQQQQVFNFSAPNIPPVSIPQPVQPMPGVTAPAPNSASQVANEIVMKVLKNVPFVPPPIVTQPFVPPPLLQQPATAPKGFTFVPPPAMMPQAMPLNFVPPTATLINPEQHLQFQNPVFNLNNIPTTVPDQFAPSTAPAVQTVATKSASNRKKIRITDPTTGEEVDISKPAQVAKTISETEPTDIENVAPFEIPPVFSLEQPPSIETKSETATEPIMINKPPPPGFEQPTRFRSASSASYTETQQVSSRPHSAMPPPGFSVSFPKAEPPKVEAPPPVETENNDWLVKHVADYLREKTKTRKLIKTEKVFAAFQKDTGSDVSVNDFMEILRSHSAIFRFSASGSKIELVEIIEMKIVQFVIAELVKLHETNGPLQTLFDAYISTMRDQNRVIHVGPKFSYDEFFELIENRANDVLILSADKTALSLSETFTNSICSVVTRLLKRENDAKPADLFIRFQEMAKKEKTEKDYDRLNFFVPFDSFIEILSRKTELYHFANSRVALVRQTSQKSQPPPSVMRQASGGLGDMDDFGDGEQGNQNCSVGIAQNLSSGGDLDCKVIQLLPEDEGNFATVEQFVKDFNETVITSSEIIPVRTLPEPAKNPVNEILADFRGTVSHVSMETRRVFVAFPRDPVGAGYSTAQDLTGDDDFTAFAQATIHNAAIHKSLPTGWCDIGRAVLFYNEESDNYGRGIIMDSFALPRTDINVKINVVESLTILDIDTGVVHEKIPARNASSLTKYREIPCLVVRCAFVLEPGALPPKRRSIIRFTLDHRTLYPPVGAKDKPAKAAAARVSRINDYRRGFSPLPVVVLAP